MQLWFLYPDIVLFSVLFSVSSIITANPVLAFFNNCWALTETWRTLQMTHLSWFCHCVFSVVFLPDVSHTLNFTCTVIWNPCTSFCSGLWQIRIFSYQLRTSASYFLSFPDNFGGFFFTTLFRSWICYVQVPYRPTPYYHCEKQHPICLADDFSPSFFFKKGSVWELSSVLVLSCLLISLCFEREERLYKVLSKSSRSSVCSKGQKGPWYPRVH